MSYEPYPLVMNRFFALRVSRGEINFSFHKARILVISRL